MKKLIHNLITLALVLLSFPQLMAQQDNLKGESYAKLTSSFSSGNLKFSTITQRNSTGQLVSSWTSPNIKVPLTNVTPFLTMSTRWNGNGLQEDDFNI